MSSLLVTIANFSFCLFRLGRDTEGQIYWYQVDDEANLRVYREDSDDETWEMVAASRDELVELISKLQHGDVKKVESDELLVPEEDSNSNSKDIEPKEILLDTGKVEESEETSESEEDSSMEIDENGTSPAVVEESVENEKLGKIKQEVASIHSFAQCEPKVETIKEKVVDTLGKKEQEKVESGIMNGGEKTVPEEKEVKPDVDSKSSQKVVEKAEETIEKMDCENDLLVEKRAVKEKTKETKSEPKVDTKELEDQIIPEVDESKPLDKIHEPCVKKSNLESVEEPIVVKKEMWVCGPEKVNPEVIPPSEKCEVFPEIVKPASTSMLSNHSAEFLLAKGSESPHDAEAEAQVTKREPLPAVIPDYEESTECEKPVTLVMKTPKFMGVSISEVQTAEVVSTPNSGVTSTSAGCEESVKDKNKSSEDSKSVAVPEESAVTLEDSKREEMSKPVPEKPLGTPEDGKKSTEVKENAVSILEKATDAPKEAKLLKHSEDAPEKLSKACEESEAPEDMDITNSVSCDNSSEVSNNFKAKENVENPAAKPHLSSKDPEESKILTKVVDVPSPNSSDLPKPEKLEEKSLSKPPKDSTPTNRETNLEKSSKCVEADSNPVNSETTKSTPSKSESKESEKISPEIHSKTVTKSQPMQDSEKQNCAPEMATVDNKMTPEVPQSAPPDSKCPSKPIETTGPPKSGLSLVGYDYSDSSEDESSDPKTKRKASEELPKSPKRANISSSSPIVGEAIEEPMILISGEGSGAANEGGNAPAEESSEEVGHLPPPRKGRGRPPKKKKEVDDVNPSPPKPRGRPPGGGGRRKKQENDEEFGADILPPSLKVEVNGNGDERPVRASRRIAQIQVKEEERRRQLEEQRLAQLKAEQAS